MKRILILGLTMVTALAFSAALAQETPATPVAPADTAKTVAPPAAQPAQDAPAAKPAEEAKPAESAKTAAMEKVTGTVVSVDAAKGLLVVKAKDGETKFTVAKDAKIEIAGKAAQLKALKKNSKVTVQYKMEGKEKVAVAIS
jgi:hypothetical protein